MTRYIGLDVHCASSTATVVNQAGRRLRSEVLETSGQALVQFVKSQPGPIEICLEEGTQSGWLVEVLSPHVANVVVTTVSKRRGCKSDADDALELARRLASGDIRHPVYKSVGQYAELRQLVKAHRFIVQDTVRMKNRIKALYRSRGVAVTGKGVYRQAERDRWIEQLAVHARQAAMLLYEAHDALVTTRKAALGAVTQQLRKHPVHAVLTSCPGIGKLRAAQLMAVIVTPHRFRKRQQLWAYGGLGVVMRSSSDWVQLEGGSWMRAPLKRTCGLNRNHNHLLKQVFKGAATTAIERRSDNAFAAAYERLLSAGTKPNLAKLTIARKLAATILAMWKRNEVYEDKQIQDQ